MSRQRKRQTCAAYAIRTITYCLLNSANLNRAETGLSPKSMRTASHEQERFIRRVCCALTFYVSLLALCLASKTHSCPFAMFGVLLHSHNMRMGCRSRIILHRLHHMFLLLRRCVRSALQIIIMHLRHFSFLFLSVLSFAALLSGKYMWLCVCMTVEQTVLRVLEFSF